MFRFGSLNACNLLAKFAVFCCLLLPTSLLAQTNTATISGTVSDPTGAAIAGATVVVDNPDNGLHRQITTNAAGVFSVPQLQPGTYSVTVSRDGFQTVKNSAVTLVIDQVANLPIAMKIGATQQTVEVSSAAPLIETSTAGLGTVIGQKETQDLPLNGRQFVQLLQLAPGTVPISV